MMPGPYWDVWQDDFRAKHGRAPFFDETVRAIQADARGEAEPLPLTEEQIAALDDLYQKPAPELLEGES